MRIDENVRKCVAFIGIQTAAGFVPLGTCFLGCVTVQGLVFGFAITANHVVEQIESDVLTLRVNSLDGATKYIEINRNSGMRHENPANDFVIYGITFDASVHDVILYPLDRASHTKSREEFYAPNLGDEVITVGLYTSHYGLTKNIPVVRVGNFAALPDEPVRTEFGYVEAYLVEMRSIAGLSGSPVFLSPPQLRVDGGGDIKFLKQKTHPIVGMCVGYHVVETKEDQISVPKFQTDSRSASAFGGASYDERNTGFAVVIPIERVLELFEDEGVAIQLEASAMRHLSKNYRPASSSGEVENDEK